MEDTKYTSVNWSEHFYLDETSPSGLRRAKSVFVYNKERYPKDSVVGSTRSDKGRVQTWQVTFNKSNYRVHRIMMTMKYGPISKDSVIDHLDGNPLNNLFSNMEIKTKRENDQNVKLYSTNTSGYAGVRQYKAGWLCSWTAVDKTKKYKCFPFKIHRDNAKELAIDYRKEMLLELNKQGMKYTERHIGF